VAVTSPGPYTFKAGRYSSHRLLLEALPAQGHGRRLLDVGGGQGYLSRILAGRGYRVVCIAGPGSIAKDFPRGVELHEADLDFQSPPVGDDYSFLLCGDVLEHLRDPRSVLRRLRLLLRPEGRLVASLPNSGHAYVRWNVLLGRFPAHDRGLFDRTHLHFFTWQGWRQLLRESGFQLERVEPTTVPLSLALPRWQDNLAIGLLESLSYGLGRLWKTLFAYQFVVVARPVEEPCDGSPRGPAQSGRGHAGLQRSQNAPHDLRRAAPRGGGPGDPGR